jgi:L-cysteine:1D-myo-inositol 2-amino-2-deoxy-alpha-D-glucopyranoside ligase
MRLFDTLTQELRPFTALGDRVNLYVCGITPYDTTHLGHAFLNVVFDTLVRTFRWQGQAVTYVQNVTDIDDDILRKSKELGLLWDELGQRETERYLDDLRAINVAMPDHYVRASDEIPHIIEMVEALLRRGFAYAREGWVYFRVAADPGFGQLATAGGYAGYETWLRTANERGNAPTDPRKDDPLDFVLWQAQQPGEPGWASPWGPGRPGWHIECSAMATRYLGPRIDIHGGGADLVFPHHTCEIAQSEHATGEHPFVNAWMHVGMVRQDGEKMSKSLGNLTRVRDLLQHSTPNAVRLLLLSYHYRTPWEFMPGAMRLATERVERLQAAASSHDEAATDGQRGEPARSACMEVATRLEDDLDTPGALVALERLAETMRATSVPGGAATLTELAGVLGLSLATTSTGASVAPVQATPRCGG